MSISSFVRTVDWVATARLAVIRAAAASVVWSGVILWNSGSGGQPFALWQPFVIFLGILLVAVPLAAVVGAIGRGLERAGFPFAWVFGLLVLPLVIVSMVGDPLVWFVRMLQPKWIAVEKFSVFNPTFLFITRAADPAPGAVLA